MYDSSYRYNTQTDTGHDDLDQLQADVLVMTAQYACTPSPVLAERIVVALTKVCRHPFIDVFPRQRECCAKLLRFWQGNCAITRH